MTRALAACEEGLSQARKHDDRLFEIQLLWQKAELIGVFSFGPGSTLVAKEILNKAREISEEIGDTKGLALIQELVQVMCHLRGEYSEAIEITLGNIRLMESIGDQADIDIHNLSALSNEIGNGYEALEWAKQTMKAYANKPLLLPVAYLDMAWSFINLNKLDEAENQLGLAKESILQSGYESVFAVEHMVIGLLNRARGDFDSAFFNLETAYEINMKENRHNRVTSCMIKLAETEVMAFEPSSANQNEETSGKWLTRLEKYGNEMELPGVIGLVLFLKGEFRLKQGRHDEAHEFADRVLQMSELPGLAYLEEKALMIHNVRVSRKRP